MVWRRKSDEKDDRYLFIFTAFVLLGALFAAEHVIGDRWTNDTINNWINSTYPPSINVSGNLTVIGMGNFTGDLYYNDSLVCTVANGYCTNTQVAEGNGTANYVAKWLNSSHLTDSNIRDTGGAIIMGAGTIINAGGSGSSAGMLKTDTNTGNLYIYEDLYVGDWLKIPNVLDMNQAILAALLWVEISDYIEPNGLQRVYLRTENGSMVPLTVHGHASQSVNLTVWENSAGTDLGWVTKEGVMYSNQSRVCTDDEPCAGTASTLQDVTDNGNTTTNNINLNGDVIMNTSSIIKWNNQSGSPQNVLRYDNYDLYLSTPEGTGSPSDPDIHLVPGTHGEVHIGGITLWPASNQISGLSALTLSNYIQVSDGFTNLASYRFSNCGNTCGLYSNGLNGTGIISESAQRFLVYGDGDVVIGNDANPDAQLDVENDKSTDIGVIIKAAPGQSANLQEWQDSSSTTLSAIDSSGKLAIGHDTPVQELDIRTSQPIINLRDTDSTGDSASAYMLFEDQTGADIGWVGDGSSGNDRVYVYNSRGDYVHLQPKVVIADTADEPISAPLTIFHATPRVLLQDRDGNGNSTTGYFGYHDNDSTQVGYFGFEGGANGHFAIESELDGHIRLKPNVGWSVAVVPEPGSNSNLQEWQDSSGGVILSVQSDGTPVITTKLTMPSYISIGSGTIISNDTNSIAIGENAQATAAETVVVGGGATVTAIDSVAVGSDSTAAQRANALGHEAESSGFGSIALGWRSKANRSSAIAIGSSASATGGDNAVAIGQASSASGTWSFALGDSSTASGSSSTALGYTSAASATRATALGTATSATGLDSLAIANLATASSTNSIAIGENSNSSHSESVALGYNAQTTSANQFMVGSSSDPLNTYIHGNLFLENPTSSNIGLTIQGAAGQSANLQEWQDSSSNIDMRVTNNGELYFEDSNRAIWSYNNASKYLYAEMDVANRGYVKAQDAPLYLVGGTAAYMYSPSYSMRMSSVFDFYQGATSRMRFHTGLTVGNGILGEYGHAGNGDIQLLDQLSVGEEIDLTKTGDRQLLVKITDEDRVGVIIEGNDTVQNSNFLQFQNSSNDVLGYVTPEAYLKVGECAGGYSEGEMCYNSTSHKAYIYNSTDLVALW